MLEKLNDREKLFVYGGIVLIVVILIFTLFNRIINFKSSLSDRVLETRGQFGELSKLINDYKYYSSLKTGQDEDVNQMYAKLDTILIRYSLKDKVSTMRDSNTIILKNYNKITIDITLRSVILEDVFRMIYDIEVNKQMNSKVEYIDFRKPLAGKEVYDINIKLSSYNKLGNKNG